VRRALEEDIGGGDLTASLIPVDHPSTAQVLGREDAVLCGTAWFDQVFHQLDDDIAVTWRMRDGDDIRKNQILCRIQGPARAVLTGERTALNFLQTLSGTATLARQYAEAVRGTRAQVLDTRKTLPGLRIAQKYAVRCGGCRNHRLGLYDGILIKENHIIAAGSLTAAFQHAKTTVSEVVPIEVEVENLAMLREALAAGVKRVLLDNFELTELEAAVAENHSRAELEVSGNVTLDNIRAIAETGVDYISVGRLTKNVRAVDLSLRFISKLNSP